MQSGSRRPVLRYRRPSTEEEPPEGARPPADEDGDDEEDVAEEAAAATAAAAAAATPAAGSSNPGAEPARSWLSGVGDAAAAAASSLSGHPAVAGAVAAALAVSSLLVGLLVSRGKRRQRGRQAHAGSRRPQAAAADEAGASSGASSRSRAKKAPPPPGPNSKVKPSPNCVPLADGSAVVVRRPIAADNSCLFNAVGYLMHHATNRAPFLRQVVSREVSSDPQKWCAATLSMENAAYCSWIVNPAHWGGGIELAILAHHYRREIAAWNLETAARHVFGEESGFTKQSMVIYNGVHYDALAVAPSPRASQEEDVTEFNPRTRRGKMILAAAQQLVQLNQKPEQRAKAKAVSGSGSGSSEQRANGPPPPGADAAASGAAPQLLACGSCGEQLAGLDAAKQHAAATGHSEFAQVA